MRTNRDQVMTTWIISGWVHFIVGLVAMYFGRPWIDKGIAWLRGHD